MPHLSAKTSIRPKTKVKPEPLLVTSPKLDTMLTEREQVAAKVDQLTGKRKALDAAIRSLVVEEAGERGAIDTGDYIVVDTHAENVVISAELLLKLGVRPAIIEKAKVRTPYAYPRITKKKQAPETPNLADVFADLRKGVRRRKK